MANKKGQIAIFIIIAVVIVGIILLLFFFKGGNPLTGGSTSFSPQSYLKTCFGDDIKAKSAQLANSGGYSNPEGYLDYNGEKIKYLCYTSDNFKTCLIQQPFVKEHFENELNNEVKTRINECMQNLKKEYEKRGYDVSLGGVDSKVNYDMEGVKIKIISPITVTKGTESKKFDGFEIKDTSEMYSLFMTTISILDYEASFGDSETTLYLQYDPDLKIEKTRLSEGSKVYRLSNVVTNESFTFASRSLVWPPGYGL